MLSLHGAGMLPFGYAAEPSQAACMPSQALLLVIWPLPLGGRSVWCEPTGVGFTPEQIGHTRARRTGEQRCAAYASWAPLRELV
jgi:hypothetical protein